MENFHDKFYYVITSFALVIHYQTRLSPQYQSKEYWKHMSLSIRWHHNFHFTLNIKLLFRVKNTYITEAVKQSLFVSTQRTEQY